MPFEESGGVLAPFALPEVLGDAVEPGEIARESGRPPPHFNLVSAAYHVSGTTGVLHESPHGLADGDTCDISHEEILEAQLSLYEALLRHAADDSGS